MNDLTNKLFGYWKALKPIHQTCNKPIKWLCECTLCGRNFTVASTSLVNGSSTKCKACASKISKRKFSNLRIERIFKAMKQRCYNKISASYKNYGNKGIAICNEWLYNPVEFENWALSNGYNDNLTIDRIDNSLGYEPSNCRWISRDEQNRNRTSLYYATINGETHCIAEWCRILGLYPNTIIARISKGMTPYEALTVPVNHKKGNYKSR